MPSRRGHRSERANLKLRCYKEKQGEMQERADCLALATDRE